MEIVKNVSDEGLLMIYNYSDLFVLHSIVDSQVNTEGLRVVLLEAVACKLPVIGSNVSGIPDLIQDKNNGLLVPEKDFFNLSNTIIMLIEDMDLRKKILIRGYVLVKEKFSWKKIAEKY